MLGIGGYLLNEAPKKHKESVLLLPAKNTVLHGCKKSRVRL
jgi:hypothetical protein